MTGRRTPRSSPPSLDGQTFADAESPLPYPHPTSPAATALMKGNRKRDTRPELLLRSELHRAGSRYRCDHPIRLVGRRPVRVDIAFLGAKVAVFVDGCFWHRCPVHGSMPAANSAYWELKLARNVERDQAVDDSLRAEGWLPLHVWEHEPPSVAAERVRSVVASRRQLNVSQSRVRQRAPGGWPVSPAHLDHPVAAQEPVGQPGTSDPP